jgi:alpha-amylase/alpha-mannosidase (GH57 family)
MARIKLCFLWHLHQPFYRDLVSGEYRLPWARLHALKDYYGMVKILDEFPDVRQTFNLVPSLLVQLEEYASGKARDRFLNVALKDAEALSVEEKEFLLSFCFQANEERVICRYPRYAELLGHVRQNGQIPGRAVQALTTPMIRDLQILSELAWFDEEYLKKDDEIRSLKNKGRGYTPEDQQTVGRKEKELLGKVLPAYRDAANRGQIEVSTSPFYHPILPLICDSNIADVSHPYVDLPARFAYPGDAAIQLSEAKSYLEHSIGLTVGGLWPPEGAVSDEVFAAAVEAGFKWTATDEGVLERSLGHPLQAEQKYTPYLWKRDNSNIHVIFRDRRLCDLIGVVYARMNPEAAADHFIRELHNVSGGGSAIVPVILDGENAWEHYADNGRPFLRALYERISADAEVEAVTITQALEEARSLPTLQRVFPGSWIDGNFDIWIGAAEDNAAWELLLRARRRFDQVTSATVRNRLLAWEELMIAEGSDWCWWYGPEHSAESRIEFDRLFREHLANVYRLLGDSVPAELSCSLLKPHEPEHRAPSGMIQPVIDGKQTSYMEWTNAGRYRAVHRSGPIHAKRSPIGQLLYGSDGNNLFLCLAQCNASQLTITLRNSSGERFVIEVGRSLTSTLPEGAVEAAIQDLCEVRVSLASLKAKAGSQLFIRIDVSSDGLTMGSLPSYGELELKQIAMAAYTY